MVDSRKLKELVKLMRDNDLSELDLRDEHETVVIKRAMAPIAGPMPVAATPASAPASADGKASKPDDDAGLIAITSPMVGTFFCGADPESPAYVSAGSSVSEDTVVCIVEAMKVFSEIKAECSGTIEKILVKNAEAVEYGQKLFLVRPS